MLCDKIEKYSHKIREGELMSKERLTDLYKKIYARPRLVRVLEIAGVAAAALVALIYACVVFGYCFGGEYAVAVKLALMAGIPFLVVSVMRSVVDLQRPYEVIDLPELAAATEGRKTGKSFPSRHVFSAFVIGTLTFYCSVPIAIAILALGVFMAVERVLLGIHFLRDTIAGAVIGVVCGVTGLLIL